MVVILFSAATIAGGVPAGAIMPYQFSMRRSGMPSSTVVGTSGAVGARAVVPSAIGFSVPRLDMRQDRRQVEKRHLHLLAEQIVDGGRRAAIGHMHDVDFRGKLEQFAGEMRQAAGAGGGEIELAGLRLGERDQLAHVLRRHVAGDNEHFRHGDDQRDRREILQGLVRRPSPCSG